MCPAGGERERGGGAKVCNTNKGRTLQRREEREKKLRKTKSQVVCELTCRNRMQEKDERRIKKMDSIKDLVSERGKLCKFKETGSWSAL